MFGSLATLKRERNQGTLDSTPFARDPSGHSQARKVCITLVEVIRFPLVQHPEHREINLRLGCRDPRGERCREQRGGVEKDLR